MADDVQSCLRTLPLLECRDPEEEQAAIGFSGHGSPHAHAIARRRGVIVNALRTQGINSRAAVAMNCVPVTHSHPRPSGGRFA